MNIVRLMKMLMTKVALNAGRSAFTAAAIGVVLLDITDPLPVERIAPGNSAYAQYLPTEVPRVTLRVFEAIVFVLRKRHICTTRKRLLGCDAVLKLIVRKCCHTNSWH